jgi:hypothetical protein
MSEIESIKVRDIGGKGCVPRRAHAPLLLAVFLALFIFNGCATISEVADREESLRSAASNYWKMRMEGKYEDTYNMEDKESLTKGNTKGLPLYEYYLRKARITSTATSHSIKIVRFLDDKGLVDVEFVLTFPEIPRPVNQTFTDEWIFKNGKWRHIFPP